MTTYEIETRTLTVESTTVSVAEIGPWLGKAFTEVASYLARVPRAQGRGTGIAARFVQSFSVTNSSECTRLHERIGA